MEIISKGLSKYIAAFDYFCKALIVFSSTSGGVCVAPFASVIGAPVRIESASLGFAFPIATRIAKKVLKTTRNKKRSIIRLLR